MQTSIDPQYKNRAEIAEAESILRSCVHCGFCTATCPTYQILGSELDSPRGRIYLIKDLLEGNEATAKTREHLDRCLTCRACETTCPSGVRYGRLVDIGRRIMEVRAPRPLPETVTRKLLLKILPFPKRVGLAFKVGRFFKPVLPKFLKNKIPPAPVKTQRPDTEHDRKMLVLEGCVQSISTPNTNTATARVLNRLGISLINAEKAGCCGAMNQHMSDAKNAKEMMRNNIDAWWPHIENNQVEAIVMTASGCGLMVKEYGEELKDDPNYADKAARISELSKDISEILQNEDLSTFAGSGKGTKVAYHSSCTLQHGQKLSGAVERILGACDYTLTPVANSHLCCGAAGTYTLLQPKLSQQLLNNKLESINEGAPDIIATANIGCQMHLASGSQTPVKHWIELLDNHAKS